MRYSWLFQANLLREVENAVVRIPLKIQRAGDLPVNRDGMRHPAWKNTSARAPISFSVVSLSGKEDWPGVDFGGRRGLAALDADLLERVPFQPPVLEWTSCFRVTRNFTQSVLAIALYSPLSGYRSDSHFQETSNR
ncbi:MAG: hypothetical protein IPL59_15085 [Candidatus Competibacteraceae bacterium]|nr:hypothetical protein [Candidatus Competibacteraceae bacterium]